MQALLMQVPVHSEAAIDWEPLPSGKRRVRVHMLRPGAHIRKKTSCETALPGEVVQALLDAHGPAGLCYVLDRIDDPPSLENILREAILGFVDERELAGKRILDFGCGSGASSVHLARMFPGAEVVGLDLVPEFLAAGRVLAEHLELDITFVEATFPDTLPNLGSFDAITLNAVFEHLLPAERKRLLAQLWDAVVPGGLLFVNQLPHRWYPFEYHTTGLPFLNYLPPRVALWAALRFASEQKRGIGREGDWEGLLRGGVRGGTEGEILRLLPGGVPLRPREHADVVDLWYAHSMARRPRKVKWAMRLAFKAITRLTGRPFVPSVTMAIRRQEHDE